MNGDDEMAYTIKPSVGMMPIEDLDKVMQVQGYIKNLKAEDIEKATQVVSESTGTITKPGINDPTLIALCAGQINEDGSYDRGTVNNALKLAGIDAKEYLMIEDRNVLSAFIQGINHVHSNEIQLLRDELYHLKTELIRTGHASDTSVACGYIDGFKNANVKYDEKTTEIDSINGLYVTQVDNIFDKGDWIVARKDKADVQSNYLATVSREVGNDLQLDIGTSNMAVDKTVLYKSLGEYNRGTYSFSKMSYGTPGDKVNYTMLNDDSNVSKMKINSDNTGYAVSLKIPYRCAGFLTNFTINGKTYGNPGPLVCYVIKGSADYIKELGNTRGLSKARADGTLIATSDAVNSGRVNNEEIVFNFTKLDYDPSDSTSSLYPEIDGAEYCFVIEADNVTEYDYWEIEFGHKKSSTVDLQTNNKAYKFYNKDQVNTSNNSFIEMPDVDMLYIVETRSKEEEDEVPYSAGLYTTLNPIKLSKPISASRARLTLEVNKEGNFVSSTHGEIKAELDAIEFRKADGTYAEQTVIGGGDSLIIGNSVVKVKTSSPNLVTVDRNIYVEPLMPIYRCGYKAQLRTYLVEENPETGTPSVKEGSECLYPLDLVAVIPSGRDVSSSVSDRLIFEVDLDSIRDDAGNVIYFNQADLQIQWSSFLRSEIIHTQASKGNDYIGRIHSLSLAFDKNI